MPSEMTAERAEQISAAMFRYYMAGTHGIEQPVSDGSIDLWAISLGEMVQAQKYIEARNKAAIHAQKECGGSVRISQVFDNRLTAALYVLLHYVGDDPREAAPIVTGDGKALLCVLLPEGEEE